MGFRAQRIQAESLDGILAEMGTAIDHVLDICVEDEIIIKRLSGRRICPECNMNYHVNHDESARTGICGRCGARLVQREDDREETVINRLQTYHNQTEPLIGYYKTKGILREVSGRYRIADTTADVYKVLGMEE